MKAISRLLIACLLVVSVTGFGKTTTDLSQNSKDELLMSTVVDAFSLDVVLKIDDLIVNPIVEKSFFKVKKEVSQKVLMVRKLFNRCDYFIVIVCYRKNKCTRHSLKTYKKYNQFSKVLVPDII